MIAPGASVSSNALPAALTARSTMNHSSTNHHNSALPARPDNVKYLLKQVRIAWEKDMREV